MIWLASQLHKAVLKLTDHDYNEEGMQDLLAEKGPAYNINLAVFRHLQSTITGWPGGKPEHAKQPGDRDQPFDAIYPKRVLIFSPHPDDDVISMGGTLIRLVDQGHWCTWPTKHPETSRFSTKTHCISWSSSRISTANSASTWRRRPQLEDHIDHFLRQKTAGQVDSSRDPTDQSIDSSLRSSLGRLDAVASPNNDCTSWTCRSMKRVA